MRRHWWETLEERQKEHREKREQPITEYHNTEARKRQPYTWGAKAYLASFNVGECREYKESFIWESLKSIATKLKKDFDCQYIFNTAGSKRYITRVK